MEALPGVETAPTPVDRDRVIGVLRRMDVDFRSGEDGQLIVPTTNVIFFWDTSNPHVFHMRAQWRGIARTNTQFTALARQIVLCNRTRTRPKAFVAPLNNNRFGLTCETTILTRQGLSDGQLSSFIETSMGLTMMFLHDLEQAVPELVTWESSQPLASVCPLRAVKGGKR